MARRRVRRWLYPESAERGYVRLLNAHLDQLHEFVQEDVEPFIPSLISEASVDLRLDAWPERLRNMSATLSAKVRAEAERIVGQIKVIAEEVKTYNAGQWRAIVKSVAKIDILSNTPLGTLVDSWTYLNSQLITRLSEDYVSRIDTAVNQGVRRGLRPEAIAKQIQAQTGISKKRAAFIARDQVATLNGQITHQRQTELGIDQYVWRTARDPKVRDLHRDREGVVFRWDTSPGDGHPGEPINCRCYAEPVLDDLLKGL